MSADDRQDSHGQDHHSPRTGARNDDSSLFSLDVLRRAEESATRPSSERDDSGLIDLRALAHLAKAPPPQVTNAPLVVSTSVGLFAATPRSGPSTRPAEAVQPVGSTEGIPDFAPKRSKVFMAIGAVGAVGIAVAAFLLMHAPAAPPVAALSAMGPEVTTPVPPSTPVAAPPPEAPQPAALTPGQRAPTAEAPTPPVAVAKAAAPRRAAGAAAPKAEAKAPQPKQEAKPAAPTCDLSCQMARAVAGTK